MWPRFTEPGTIEPFCCRTAAAGLWCRAHVEDMRPHWLCLRIDVRNVYRSKVYELLRFRNGRTLSRLFSRTYYPIQGW